MQTMKEFLEAATWTVVVFGSAGEIRRVFYSEKEAQNYAARARRATCLARIERSV